MENQQNSTINWARRILEKTIQMLNISFLGLWEQMHNSNFKGIEFETFENEAGKK